MGPREREIKRRLRVLYNPPIQAQTYPQKTQTPPKQPAP